jgi:hypothetical protein
VLDPELLLTFANNPRVTLVDADAFGLLAEFTTREHPEGSEVRRHRMHSLTAILLARLSSIDRGSFSAAQAAKEVLTAISELAASVATDGTPALARPAVAIDWLIEQFKPTARLALPGSLAAYQEGVHQAVSLPLEDLVRILTGKPAAPRITRKTDPSSAALSPFTRAVESTSIPSGPLPAIRGVHTTPASRACAISLHREIRHQITQIVRKRDNQATLEVDVAPFEAVDLPGAHAGREADQKIGVEVLAHRLQDLLHLRECERLDVALW